jgi:predicted O-linked N-acetylglucosamine transferase (SPINDLY family)
MADVFLDNFPYNCGSTTRDVIAAGVPIITMSGATLVSRMGGSILNSLQIPELITSSTSKYTEMAINLNNSKMSLLEIKRKIFNRLNSSNSSKKIIRSLECELIKINK